MVNKITGKTAPSIVTWTRNSLPIPDAFIQRPHWPRMWAVPAVAKRSESLHAESQGCQRNEREERLASLLAGLKHLEFGFKGRNKNKGQAYQRQPIQHAAQLVVANTNVSVARQGQQPPKRCQHFRRKSQHEELFRQRLVHDKIVLFGMLVHKPTPLATYRFHGSRASPGKRANPPCGVLELDLSGLATNQDLTAEIVKAAVFCVEYQVIWLHGLWPNGSPVSRFSLACLSISQNSFGRRGMRKDSLLY